MATIQTYDLLVQYVQDYLERGTSVDQTVYDQLPNIINRAERVLGRSVKLTLMCVSATASFTASGPTLTKPERWRQTISINYGTGTGNNTRNFLFPRSYEYIRTVYPDDTATAAPRYYAEYDYEHWLIGPTPDQAYPFEVMYYANPEYLSSSNQTNWWSEFAPELLQSRVLLEAAIFLKNTEMQQVWEAEYQKLLAAINSEDQEKVVDRATVRRSA